MCVLHTQSINLECFRVVGVVKKHDDLPTGGENAEHVATSGVEHYDTEKDEWPDWGTALTQELSCH